jgi:hypothetical protein
VLSSANSTRNDIRAAKRRERETEHENRFIGSYVARYSCCNLSALR